MYNSENLLTKVVLCLHLLSDDSVTGLTVPTASTIHPLFMREISKKKLEQNSKNRATRRSRSIATISSIHAI